MTTVADVLKLIEENGVKFADLRFTDTKGKEQHVSIPAKLVTEDFFSEGKMFDGSSMAGWKGVDKSDMILMPDADTVFVEATSGNTGIALAAICAAKGYHLVITMPENTSKERILLMRHFGAEVILTPQEDGMQGAIAKADLLAEKNSNVILLGQFTNQANPDAHRFGTSIEILEDTGGDVDVLVSAVGTSGTLSGIAQALKTSNPDLYVAAVEPKMSAVLNGGIAGKHHIPGIGAGFVPPLYQKELVDEVFDIEDDDARDMAKAIAQTEGLPIGISAGAAMAAAVELAMRDNFKDKNIVVILPDAIINYVSEL